MKSYIDLTLPFCAANQTGCLPYFLKYALRNLSDTRTKIQRNLNALFHNDTP